MTCLTDNIIRFPKVPCILDEYQTTKPRDKGYLGGKHLPATRPTMKFKIIFGTNQEMTDFYVWWTNANIGTSVFAIDVPYFGRPSTVLGIFTTDLTENVLGGELREVDAEIQILRVDAEWDDIYPVITIIGDNPLEVVGGGDFTDPGATATDNIDGDITNKILVTSNLDIDNIGEYFIKYSVTDTSYNTTTETRVVRVTSINDTKAPEITIKGNNPYTHSIHDMFTPGCTFVKGNNSLVDEIDNGDGTFTYETIDNSSNPYKYIRLSKTGYNGCFTRDLISGEVIRIVLIVKDIVLQSGSTEFVVERTDNGTVPIQPNTTMILPHTSNGDPKQYLKITQDVSNIGDKITFDIVNSAAILGYVDEGATAIDNIDGNISDQIVVTSNVDDTVEGQYQVEYESTDSSSNSSTAVRTVNVVNDADVTPPVITLNGDAHVEIYEGETYNDAGATATDDVDGDITANIIINNNVDTSTPDTYNVTYDVQDAAGNWADQVVREVLVKERPSGSVEYSIVGSDSFTVPDGIDAIRICAIGGGGSGGANNNAPDSNSSAGGGYAGERYNNTISVTPGETLAIQIAAGGGSVSGDNGNGVAGGTTTISRNGTVIVSLSGGAGGTFDDNHTNAAYNGRGEDGPETCMGAFKNGGRDYNAPYSNGGEAGLANGGDGLQPGSRGSGGGGGGGGGASGKGGDGYMKITWGPDITC